MRVLSGWLGMRGSDQRSGSLFSYVDLERRARAEGSSVAGDPDDRRCGAVPALSGAFAAMYAPLGRPSIAPAGKAAASPATSGVLYGALRASTDGAAGVRSAVPLVCRARYRRSGSGTILCSRRTGSGFWRRRLLPGSSMVHSRSGRDPEASVRRALLGRWNTGGGLGEPEELQAQEGQGWRRASGIIGTQRRGRFPWPEAEQPDPRLDHRSGRQALSQGIRHGSQAQLHRSRPDGKPQRPLRRGTADQCIGSCRETGRARYDRALCRQSHSDHAGRRQGLRCRWLHHGASAKSTWRRTWPKTATRRSAIDRRTTRHPGYDISQRVRKRIEEGFGWMKTIGGMRKPKYRSREKVAWSFTFAAAAYNLIRLPKLMAQRAWAPHARQYQSLLPLSLNRRAAEKSATSSTAC